METAHVSERAKEFLKSKESKKLYTAKKIKEAARKAWIAAQNSPINASFENWFEDNIKL